MMFAAHVKRIKDGKEFVLGLAELKATDKKSANHQLLDDYAVWFVNNRQSQFACWARLRTASQMSRTANWSDRWAMYW
jgi:hypothetical protein